MSVLLNEIYFMFQILTLNLSLKVNNESLRFNQFSHEVKPSHLKNKSELNIR